MPAAVTAALDQSQTRTIARLRLVTAVSLLLPLLLFAVMAVLLYREQFAESRRTLESHARILQEQALKMLESNEMLLERMLDVTGDDSEAELLARGAELHLRLKDMARALPQVRALSINGADSRPLANSLGHPPRRDLDFTDRAWFKAHRAGDVGTLVSELLIGRSTGEPIFDVNRRRNLRDGSFGGTVHVNLRPDYLIEFYKELATASPGLRMALLRQDGQYLARWPGELTVGLAVPPGSPLMDTLRGGGAGGYRPVESPFDGQARLLAWRKLGAYPLYVTAGLDRSTVIAAWARELGLMALFLVPSSLAFAAMAWSALRRTRSEFEALRRLEQEMVHRLRAETALVTTQKLEAMGRLTGGVAHDFNNLLMILNTTLFLHKKLHPQLADDNQLAAMQRAIASGTKLTRQLLAFARKQPLRPERTDLSVRLPELLALIKPIVGSTVEVTCEVAPGTGTIDVDPAELELAMINLAVNARDAMQGSGRLTIHARDAAAAERPAGVAADELVLIEVIDSGSGIGAADAAQLFEPFYTTKALGQGTGLGLSQVLNLCQSAGGTATIDNAPGSGARVRLFFARSAGAAPREEPALAAAPALDCHVLLVEDNDAVAESTAELLRAIGCRVERVAHGQAALERVDARNGEALDVVLSDIEMPGELDGIALAGRLSRHERPLPVVLMTGYAARMEEAGAQGLEVLPKPCSPQLLAAAIRKAQARPRAAAQWG
jgi:signal transduction histidine kinase